MKFFFIVCLVLNVLAVVFFLISKQAPEILYTHLLFCVLYGWVIGATRD